MLSKAIVAFALATLFSSCGYHFTPTTYEGEQVSITIPYIQGDPEALLNNELANVFARSGRFTCVQSGGDLMLQVVILSDANNRVGYRYDRDTVTGARKPNILSIENRRNITTQVTLFDAHSGEVLFGPIPIKASVDYDYVDSGSPDDLSTTTPYGTVSTIRYSYGQLNTVEGAHDDASPNLYRGISQRIMQSVINKLYVD